MSNDIIVFAMRDEAPNLFKKYKNIYPREGAEKFQVIIRGGYIGTALTLNDAVIMRDSAKV